MSKVNKEELNLSLTEAAEQSDCLEANQSFSSLTDQSGDTLWSTAPNTPISEPKSITDTSSYEKAILNSDALWEWNSSSNGPKENIPDPKQKSKPPAHISYPNKSEMTDGPSNGHYNKGDPSYPPEVDVIQSNNSNIKVGFLTPLDTTNLAELPGSRTAVITAPPRSGDRPRTRSIEETSNEMKNYAPTNPIPASEFREGADSVDSGKGSSVAKKTSRKLSMTPSTVSIQGSSADPDSVEDKGISEEAYAELTKSGVCYDFIPKSTKIVVFDTRLRVKKAFFALVANGIRAAPLWDSGQQKFVGMLTITDFINILRHHYRSPIAGMDELENQTIQEWMDFEKKVVSIQSSLIQIGPEESLYEGIRMLVEHKIHRLPVINPVTGNALYIFTHKRILKILMQNIPEEAQPQYMFKSLEELGIGSYENIATASQDTPIITALNIFHKYRVSALPIVDASNRVVDIYAKFDVINLAAERTYTNLDVNLRDALQHRSTGFEGVHTCYLHESLYTIVMRLIDKKVHRLVVVNMERHVIGVISLSDILKFLVMRPHT